MGNMDSLRRRLGTWIFYTTDFKDGYQARKWWMGQFAMAVMMDDGHLKSWASDALDYVDDFRDDAYYIRNDVEQLLREISEA